MRSASKLFIAICAIVTLVALVSAAVSYARHSGTEDGRVVFRPEDYGARGDGKTDDTGAFVAMHAAIIAHQNQAPAALVTIELGKPRWRLRRHYVYRWNRWTWGIRDLIVEGNGSTIQNVSDSPWHIEQLTLRTNRDAFHTQGYYEDEEANDWENFDRFGYPIVTAPAGAAFVQLRSSDDAGAFQVGKLALVASYDQQGNGYPPNPRYYDWVRVTGVDGSRIAFEGQKLRHEHRDDLPYRADRNEPELPVRDLIDNAVIVPAEREIPWGDRLVIRNLTTAENPNVQGGAMDAVGTLHVDSVRSAVLDGVSTRWLVIAMTQDVTVRNSSIAGEPDKINGKIRFENSTVSFTEAAGVERLEVVESTALGRLRTMARESYFDRVTFDFTDTDPDYRGALYIEGFAPVYLLEVTNSRLVGSADGDESVFSTYEPTIAFTIDGENLILEGNALMAPAQSGMWDVGMNTVYEGMEIGLDGPDGAPKGCGRVRSIRSGGSLQTAAITVDWAGARPADGDRVSFFEVTEIRGENNVLKDADLYRELYGVGKMVWNGKTIVEGPCARY